MGLPARTRRRNREGKRTRQWIISTQNSATNAWNWNSGSWNNNNKNNNNAVVPFFDKCKGAFPVDFYHIGRMKEYVSFAEVQQAYFDCRLHKRTKPSSLEYELNYEQNNLALWEELNNGTYEIGRAICFCVSRPKVREVFAASFRDRIVHHLLMNRMLPIFEANFIPDTYNCRKGKGVFYGVQRIAEQVRAIGRDCWCLKIDLSAFFMSIDKNILWDMTESLVREKWQGKDVDWWLALLKKVVMNRPEQNCERHGNTSLWDELPRHKSLFGTDGKGLPIGNLTSQILANHYLTRFDKWLSPKVGGYGRYVDDIILLDTDRKKLLGLLNPIRYELARLNLRLNESKTTLQRADKGILFVGYVIKPWGIYAGRPLVRGSLRASRFEGEHLDRHLNRLNSYMGFLIHTLSYAIRHKMWMNTIERYSGIYAKGHINSIHKIKHKSK